MAKRALLVDDAAFMRMMLREILTQGGYEVIGEAGDGNEGAEAYRTLQPDFVTLDIVMPNLDGLGALKVILETDPNATVFMVSAMGQDTLIEEAKGAGAKGFIVKPFRPQAVLETLKQALGE